MAKLSIGKLIPWESLLKLMVKLIMTQVAPRVTDEAVDGSKLSKDQKRGVQTLSALNDIWMEPLSKETDTDYDDQAYALLNGFCDSTAEEGAFKLPVVEMIL